ncbi:Dihydrolipoyllysine-residue acetyltransferase component of pyruvate dehydrogenase complex [Candidatus Rubidus massiliensis]|nr:Dihydrolipoyllysine-residue acetyltransferase component of pyruvate dehydrogenase complex [Candidatus Rubidus massiliensis]
MPFNLNMPKLSPTMEDGTIAKWHKKEGDQVEIDDLLFEVATDKATVEYNAIDSGWLRKILVKEGEEAKVNQPVAILTEEQNEPLEEDVSKEAVSANKEEKLKQESIPQEVNANLKKSDSDQSKETKPVDKTSDEKRVLASPLAKKLAKEKGIDLSKLKGTGPNKRIMSRDLEGGEKSKPATMFNLSHREAPVDDAGSFDIEKLTPMRKVISQRLLEAKTTIPHIYVEMQVDAKPIIDLREQLFKLGIAVSLNDIVVKCTSLALKEHPNINSGFDLKNNAIIRYKTIDISVAVSLKDGLITPIIKHANFKTLGEISAEIRELAQRGKNGKLQPDEYQGGSFTVSNLGMFGVKTFQAIINPPQAAILAVGTTYETPVAKNGIISVGKMMNLVLSCDHRVIDGVAAAQFLQTLKNILEHPIATLL